MPNPFERAAARRRELVTVLCRILRDESKIHTIAVLSEWMSLSTLEAMVKELDVK